MEFTEILQEYDVPYHMDGHHHSTAGWIQIDCPFCGRDSSGFHMGFSVEGSFINCWKCGFHSLIHVLSEITGESFQKCKLLVLDMDIPIYQKEKPKGRFQPPKGIGKLTKSHKMYLEKRGFDSKKLKHLWDIRGIGISSDLAWRIYIPIIKNGKHVSWTTRSLRDNGVRYLSAKSEQESISHQTLLYGEDYVRHCIIVCEGPTDVWKIGPGAVATLGMNISQSQINKISRYPCRVIIFDNEKEAQRRACVLKDTLSLFPGSTFNVLLDSKDAGSASYKEIKKIRKLFLKGE